LSHDHLHGIEVVPLDLEIGNPAVALRGLYVAVPEKILDRAQIGIGVEKLRGHRVPQMMTRDAELGFAGVGFHALLDAADRERLTRAGALLHQKDLPGSEGALQRSAPVDPRHPEAHGVLCP
jgi:hypothetical protein